VDSGGGRIVPYSETFCTYRDRDDEVRAGQQVYVGSTLWMGEIIGMIRWEKEGQVRVWVT
jgi:hypothetical protein